MRVDPKDAPELHVPTLAIPPVADGEPFSTLSGADLLFDGKEFPFATMGDVTLEFQSEGFVAVRLTIPVRIVGYSEPERDVEADMEALVAAHRAYVETRTT